MGTGMAAPASRLHAQILSFPGPTGYNPTLQASNELILAGTVVGWDLRSGGTATSVAANRPKTDEMIPTPKRPNLSQSVAIIAPW